MIVLLFIPAAVSAGAAILGARRDRGAALVLAVAAGLGASAVAASAHDPQVSTSDFVKGIALATVAGGLAPVGAYWLLGRALHSHRVALAVVWLVALAPLGYYLVMCWLATTALTNCPPGAYECPV